MMFIREKHLTKSEEDLMQIFWQRKEPLTSVEISNISVDRSWSSMMEKRIDVGLYTLFLSCILTHSGGYKEICQVEYLPTISLFLCMAEITF